MDLNYKLDDMNDYFREGLSVVGGPENGNRKDAAAILAAGFMIANSLNNVAEALHRLGNSDAATNMGGLEALGVCIKEVADAINRLPAPSNGD